MYRDTTIIIPTLNEENSILKLIKTLKRLYPKAKIIVADDGSKDKTREMVKKHARLLDRSEKKIHGLSASILDAVKLVKSKYVVVMDADLQHPPKKVKQIIENLRSSYDVVVGNREKIEGNWAFNRKLMSKTATLLGQIRLMRKFECKDILSGFFGIKTNIIRNIKKEKFELKGFKILFDILKAVPKETKLIEVPYVFKIRSKDESKIRNRHAFIFLRSLFK